MKMYSLYVRLWNIHIKYYKETNGELNVISEADSSNFCGITRLSYIVVLKTTHYLVEVHDTNCNLIQ